jgi:hypothetical protein
MRWMRRIPFLLLAAMLACTGLAGAQQLPVTGCRAAANCGYKGFSTLLSSAGENYPASSAFAVSLSVAGGKLQARVARVPSSEIDWRAIDAAVDIFVRTTPLRKPRSDVAAPGDPDGSDQDSSPR